MLVFAIDTSGRHGSVALCRGDTGSFQTLQVQFLEGGTYSARLMPTIASMLEKSGLSKEAVDGFVVVSGPGSFTGLRVGLATVKGLCEILSKPLATVSLLEAVVLTRAAKNAHATAVLDAGRGEIYVGEYQVDADAGRATPVREYIAKLADFASEAKDLPCELLTPAASVAEYLCVADVRIRLVPAVQANEIGHIGLRKLLAGEITDWAAVDVNYIRRSDAEIFSSPNR